MHKIILIASLIAIALSGCDEEDGESLSVPIVTVGTPSQAPALKPLATSTPIPALTVVRKVRDDFNGDGRSDVLWQNYSSGGIVEWNADANGVFSLNPAVFEHQDPFVGGKISFGWAFVGRGDFNGDGYSDLFWRNGDVLVEWTSSGNGNFTNNVDAQAYQQAKTYQPFFPFPVDKWVLLGTGDFNGDGRSDLLWRDNTNGQIQVWSANEKGVFAINAAAATILSISWQMLGTGDFNGDGRNDILWRNNDATISEWLADSNGVFTHNVAALTFLSREWNVIGIGDYNGDGRSDVLWRNNDTTISEWLADSNGVFTHNVAALTFLSPEWRVIGTGDYNGDGRSDILWQNGNVVSEWLTDANGVFAHNPAALTSFASAWVAFR